MAEQRKPRETETREHSERKSDKWIPQTNLPNPNPREGWVHRWVRTSTLGNADVTNVSQRLREGWEPCKADEYPELQVMSDLDSRFTDGIEIGGLLLCRAPEELMQKRDKHFADVAAQQMESVDRSYMRENDPRMPLLETERKTRTSFGRG